MHTGRWQVLLEPLFNLVNKEAEQQGSQGVAYLAPQWLAISDPMVVPKLGTRGDCHYICTIACGMLQCIIISPGNQATKWSLCTIS
jgi:hypothetical protein